MVIVTQNVFPESLSSVESYELRENQFIVNPKAIVRSNVT